MGIRRQLKAVHYLKVNVVAKMLIDPVLGMSELATSVHADRKEVSLDDGESTQVGQRGEKCQSD